MSDPRFFKACGPFTVGKLAEASGSTILRGDPNLSIRDLAPLDAAGPDTISFLENPKYASQLSSCQAGAIILLPELADHAPRSAALILSTKPRKAYARIAQLFYPVADDVADAISPAAHVMPSARLGYGCVIDAGAVIGENVTLGANVRIGPNATIGRGVEIGDQTHIGANASVSHCLIGARVRVLPGARIGQEGFGFAMDEEGHVRIPQLGRVIIRDDVEIGANSTIDRGAGPDTIIESGTMIDNLVQIGHNVIIGRGSVIVAQAGISGSSKLGDHVVIGGQAGIAGHLSIGSGAQIAGHSGIMRNVAPGERMMGYPATTLARFFRQVAWLGKNAGGKKGE